MTMFDLTGKVALVTGAGGMGAGTGAGIARMLAGQGAAVAVNDVSADGAGATAAAIEAAGGSAVAAPFDVTDYASVLAGVAAAEAAIGPIDILVNNAGGALGLTPFLDSDPQSWAPILGLNLHGVLNCCHVVVRGMRERGWGRVITIASGAGVVGLDIGVSLYAAGKGGAIGFMRHLAWETAPHGITANCIALGLMGSGEDTDVQQVEHGVGRMVPRSPITRLGRAADPGACCVYLASQEANWVTGQTFNVDGGAVTH